MRLALLVALILIVWMYYVSRPFSNVMRTPDGGIIIEM